MNTDYDYTTEADETEAETMKWDAANQALGSELLALGLHGTPVMSSMNGDGFTAYLDVTSEEREEVYTKFAQALGIEVDEDENFYSEVNEYLAKRLDNLFDWN